MPESVIIRGDLLDQDVDVIVNPWNRNFLPWWLLLPQGVSGAIKRRAGYAPFRELARIGPLRTGQAVHTSAGRLPHQGIIHVAGINALWFATEASVRTSVLNALALAHEFGYKSIALPLIGAGTGSLGRSRSQQIIMQAVRDSGTRLEVRIVLLKPKQSTREATLQE